MSLLDALIRYLRGSLARARAERGTLGDELKLLEAYLEILKKMLGMQVTSIRSDLGQAQEAL